MTKKSIIFIAIIAVLSAGVAIMSMLLQPKQAPYVELSQSQKAVLANPEKDTTAEITQDLESINLGDIDKDFEEIDKDLQSL